MSDISMHPPADRRCQIYVGGVVPLRCQNMGTRWLKWSGCGCIDPSDEDACLDDFFSWECAGEHTIVEAADGSA